MASLICGLWKEMIQMNLWNRKRLTDLENELMIGRGTGWLGSLGLTCTHCSVQSEWPPRSYWTAQGALPRVTWQPGWEGGLGENGYTYMNGWVPSLFTWSFHSIVNQLHPNTKQFKNKIKIRLIQHPGPLTCCVLGVAGRNAFWMISWLASNLLLE